MFESLENVLMQIMQSLHRQEQMMQLVITHFKNKNDKHHEGAGCFYLCYELSLELKSLLFSRTEKRDHFTSSH